jgi:hypothetical protein
VNGTNVIDRARAVECSGERETGGRRGFKTAIVAVTLCGMPPAAFLHSTVSPICIVKLDGLKKLSPTVTTWVVWAIAVELRNSKPSSESFRL